ncbi:MAG: TetR/AcrR family transcriptional regulator [Pseudomonadota bacterium]
MQVQKNKRLTRSAWVNSGIDVLRQQGADALKAEPMARYMKTTKGSFYWHFKDVEDFQGSILTLWEQAAIVELSRVLEQETGSVACFQALAQSLADPAADNAVLQAESAVRAWSTNANLARDVVARVDEARLSVLTTVLKRIGIANPEVAHMIYGAAIGMPLIADQTKSGKSEAIGSLVDLVLALR